MNTSEVLMLIQAIVLAITGIIIYWYTKETQKIRTETKNQNEILAEQLRILKDQYLKNERREKSILEPILIYNGGGSSADGIDIRIINKGARIRNIKVINLPVSHTYFPKDLLESDKEIKFHFQKLNEDLPEQIQFEIEYEDKFGDKRSIEMLLLPRKHQIKEK